MHFDYSDSQISFDDSFYADPDYLSPLLSKKLGLCCVLTASCYPQNIDLNENVRFQSVITGVFTQ